MADAIKIKGLREFTRGLKQIDRDLPKALRIAFNDAANIVLDDARTEIPTRTGRALRTVKARSTRTKARVVAGGNRAPYYPWLDFGGHVGRRNSVSRPYLPKGRYLYPAYDRARESGEFQEALSDALVKVARSAGLEIT